MTMAAHDRTERVPSPVSGSAPAGPAGSGETGGQRTLERVGPYRLLEEIGEGGMGIVHLALDPRGRAVAIKVLRAHVAHDAEARTRLGREVETLSRIRDNRVASVIDADVMGPRPYIVTRYVPGPALDETVERDGPLGADALLRLARGVAGAIRAIHACGVVHRDIKPANVLLEDGEPVLIDFGIAHLQDDVRHTVGGLVMGTPGYLSPELVEGAAITDATDWWGWAATITYAASGRPPFGRGRMDAVLSRVRLGEVDLDGVDPKLVPLLRASLSPNPSRRPHAAEVIDALERYAAGQPATVPEPVGGPWDEPTADLPPVGSTQVLLERGTAALPAAVPETSPPPRWSPPSGPARIGSASPAAYEPGLPPPANDRGRVGVVPVEGRGAGQWANGDWRDEAGGGADGRERDPRIDLAVRTGLLAALGTAWLGALSAWPGVACVALVVWSAAARATDRSVTALVRRRYDHGRRRSDVSWAICLGPWHVLVGLVATAVSLLLPLAVTLAGIFASALLLAGARGGAVRPGDPLTLVVGGALGLLMVWWGPGGASLRRGSRSLARRLVPEGTAAVVVAALLVVAGLVAATVALQLGSPLDWTPFPGNPLGF